MTIVPVLRVRYWDKVHLGRSSTPRGFNWGLSWWQLGLGCPGWLYSYVQTMARTAGRLHEALAKDQLARFSPASCIFFESPVHWFPTFSRILQRWAQGCNTESISTSLWTWSSYESGSGDKVRALGAIYPIQQTWASAPFSNWVQQASTHS
jgi:hypothetical protein